MRPYFRARLFLVSFIVATLVSLVAPLAPQTSAKVSRDMNTTELAKSYTYLYSLSACMRNEINAPDGFDKNLISPENAVAGKWFTTEGFWTTDVGNDNTIVIGYLDGNAEDDQNEILCASIPAKAAALWGYDSKLELLCSFYQDNDGRRRDDSGCMEGNGSFTKLGPDEVQPLIDAVTAKVYGGKAPNSNAAEYNSLKYELYMAAFLAPKGCAAKQGVGTGDDKFNYTITIASAKTGGDGYTTKSVRYTGIDKGSSRSVFIDHNINTVKQSCAEIASQISALAQPYANFLTLTNAELSNVAACSENSESADCVASDTSTSSCTISGVGWIVCPILTFVAGINDTVYNQIDNFLEVDSGLLSSGSGTEQGWGVMRNFANVGFVIAFLVIIFSQLSGIGITNYGIKKLLPKIIIVAILINLSFILSQIAVDLSNILGASLKDLLTNIAVFDEQNGGFFSSGNLFTNITAALIGTQAIIGAAGVAIVGAGMYGGVGLLIAVVLLAIVAVLITMLILAARQALIVILIVLAPVALLAMLLPNTNKLYQQWLKYFIAMLVLFPQVALLFGGAQLAANIIAQNDGQALIAIAVATLPLFAVIPILKGSLNAVPMLGNMANKLYGAATGGLKKSIRERGTQARKNFSNDMRTKALNIDPDKMKTARGKRLASATRWMAGGSARRKLRDEGFTEDAHEAETKYAAGYALDSDKTSQAQKARATSALDSIEKKQTDARTVLLRSRMKEAARSGTDEMTYATQAFHSAIAAGDTEGALAAHSVLQGMGGLGVQRIKSVLGSEAATKAIQSRTETGMAVRAAVNASGVKGKDVELQNFGWKTKDVQVNGKTVKVPLTMAEILSDTSHVQSLTTEELAGQHASVISRAAIDGKITKETAEAVLSTPGASSKLTNQTREMFTQIANGQASKVERVEYKPFADTGTTNSQSTDPTVLSVQQASGAVRVDTPATRGSNGTGGQKSSPSNPFIVDSSGEATQATLRQRAEAARQVAAQGTTSGNIFIQGGDSEAPTVFTQEQVSAGESLRITHEGPESPTQNFGAAVRDERRPADTTIEYTEQPPAAGLPDDIQVRSIGSYPEMVKADPKIIDNRPNDTTIVYTEQPPTASLPDEVRVRSVSPPSEETTTTPNAEVNTGPDWFGAANTVDDTNEPPKQ